MMTRWHDMSARRTAPPSLWKIILLFITTASTTKEKRQSGWSSTVPLRVKVLFWTAARSWSYEHFVGCTPQVLTGTRSSDGGNWRNVPSSKDPWRGCRLPWIPVVARWWHWPTSGRVPKTVYLLGAVSSPSCANFALKWTADDNEGKCDNEALNPIRSNLYVDDCLKSVLSEKQAICLGPEIGMHYQWIQAHQIDQ